MMKKYLSYLIFIIPLIIIIPFLFQEIRDLSIYYVPVITTLVLLSAILSIYSITITKEIEERIFFILFGLSMLIYLLNYVIELVDVIAFYYNETWINYMDQWLENSSVLGLFDDLYDFIGKIPIFILLTYRAIKDLRLLKKGTRIPFLYGSLLASTGFITSGIIVTRLAVSNGVPREDIILYMPFLVLDILIMALLLSLYIAYIELNFRYYIFALFIGYVFAFFGDVYQVFYGVFDDIKFRGTTRIFDILAFGYILTMLVWIRGRKLSISTLSQIEEERKKYRDLYLELGDKVQNLLVLTQLLRHDLGNDTVVIANALELYKEKGKEDLLELAIKRLKIMEERIISLRSTSEVSKSLKIQEFPTTIIEEVVDLFENVELRIKNKDANFVSNQLFSFILFNIIENCFRHGGENVKVEVIAEAINDSFMIQVKDDGIGMSEEQKQDVYKTAPIVDETAGLPKSVGLRLARTILSNVGGSLVIEDNKPQGTIIILNLPLA